MVKKVATFVWHLHPYINLSTTLVKAFKGQNEINFSYINRTKGRSTMEANAVRVSVVVLLLCGLILTLLPGADALFGKAPKVSVKKVSVPKISTQYDTVSSTRFKDGEKIGDLGMSMIFTDFQTICLYF